MRKRIFKVVKPTAIVLAIGFTYIIIHKLTGFALFCPYYQILHIYCPGCGVSRMLLHLMKLEFYEAFSSNCLLFCLLPIFTIAAARHVYLYIRYGKKGFSKLENVLCWIIVGLLLVFAVVRNIFPIDILIP